MTKQRLVKIIAWTLGMSVIVPVMLSKGNYSTREQLGQAAIGTALGLIIGSLVPLPRRKAD